jgi:hypothetical protein
MPGLSNGVKRKVEVKAKVEGEVKEDEFSRL